MLQQSKYLQHTLAGKSNAQIAVAIGMPQGSNPEKQLYPDTYRYTAGTSDIDLLKRAHLRMSKALQAACDERDTNLPYKMPADLLTLASVVEKETALPQERSKAASVFVNRLRIGMRLQTDPTVIYGMGDRYNGRITCKDLVSQHRV